MNGLHLIGDLTGCRCDPQLLLDGAGFRAKCLAMVEAAGLTTMDATFHTFEGGGFTGTVVLAESHLAIHTWPERQGLTLDVYVCNYSADNSVKARKLFDQIVEHFQPTEAARHEVDRGEHMLMEPLNDSTGFYIKATKQLGEWQTRFQKMAIYETPHYGKLFRLDGFNMTSEKDEFVYHENLIHPALTAHAAPKKVLIIGGGDGGSSEEALKHPSVEQVTMVEIDGDVIEVAKEHFKAVHNGVFDNPKLRVLRMSGYADEMVAATPEAYVSTMSKAKRVGKIFIDYFRNDYTATAIADYCVRARPGAPVALPLDWKELKSLTSASQFTMQDVLKRLKGKRKGSPEPARQSLP